MIDLHCHSSFSDGIHTPSFLLQKAKEANLTLFSLTDHDTIEGCMALLQDASCYPLRVISGVELSAKYKTQDVHILGYDFDPNHSAIISIIERQKACRLQRAQHIAAKCSLLNIQDALPKACAIAGHIYVGRPHFAQVLIQEGRAKDMQSAFRKYLQRGAPLYEPTAWVTVEEAVEAIVAAKGQAVLAHPLKYALTNTKLQKLMHTFIEAKGVGIEVVSGGTTACQIARLADLSVRYQLLASSGSDYHGEGISRVPLGKQQPLPSHCTPIWQQWE